MVCSTSGHAQVSARIDLTTTTRYVWHGLERVSCCLVFEPTLAAGFESGALTIDGGITRYYEPFPAAGWSASEVGAKARGLGEQDLWTHAGVNFGPLEFEGGVVRYLFYGQAPKGGLDSSKNTTEIYVGVRAQGTYVHPTIESWWDVERVRGAFVRLSASLPALAWPFPSYVFTYIDGDLGVNIGQGPAPGHVPNFAGRGITHAGLGGTVDVRTGQVPGGQGVVSLGLRTQVNFDDATRVTGSAHRSDLVAWVWGGFTVLIGGDARSSQ